MTMENLFEDQEREGNTNMDSKWKKNLAKALLYVTSVYGITASDSDQPMPFVQQTQLIVRHTTYALKPLSYLRSQY